MFLSKKNASYFNKPKNVDPNKPKRILGGTNSSIQDGKTTNNRRNKLMIFHKKLKIKLS